MKAKLTISSEKLAPEAAVLGVGVGASVLAYLATGPLMGIASMILTAIVLFRVRVSGSLPPSLAPTGQTLPGNEPPKAIGPKQD